MALGRTPLATLVVTSFVVCGSGALRGARAATKTKIACVGASTTSGDGSTAGHHYPDELQRLVGTDAEVRNFGVSGTTMLRAVSASYWKTPALAQALDDQPDIAIIWFGGNDAKPENWTAHKGEFLGDYEAMIQMFQALPSHPRTYVILSLLTRDTEGIPKAVVDGEVIPLVRQAAAETGSGVVDVHDDLADHPEYFPDGIHPDDVGTVAVAKLVYATISAAPDASAGDGPAADGPVADTAPGPADAGVEMPAVSMSPQPVDAAISPDGATGTETDAAAAAAPRGPSAHSGGCAVAGGATAGQVGWVGLLVILVGASRRRAQKRRQP